MLSDYLEAFYEFCSSLLQLYVTLVYYFFTRKVSNLKKDKSVVLITGCDTGFGNALSLELTQQGYHVISTCLTDDGLQMMKGRVAKVVHCEVSVQEDVDKLAVEVDNYLRSNRELRLWAVVNNAGVAPIGNMDWMDVAQYQKAIDVNYFGAIRVTKAMLPHLKKTKFSRIVNLSCVFGVMGWPAYGPYAGGKHALEGAMKCIRMELRPWNIRVVNVNPSFMKTAWVPKWLDTYKKRYQEAEPELKQQYSEENVTKTANVVVYLQEDPGMVIKALANLMVVYDPPFNHYVGMLAQLCKLWLSVPQGIREYFDFLSPPPLAPYRDVVQSIQGH